MHVRQKARFDLVVGSVSCVCAADPEALVMLSAGAVQASPQPALAEPKTQDTAERRQITVMFSDMVGSTALSTRMDPEDLREVISAYQKCVVETVRPLWRVRSEVHG